MKSNLPNDSSVPILLAANYLADIFSKGWQFIEPKAATLAYLGQVAVATATVYYIMRKARAIKVEQPAKKEKNPK